MAEQPLAAPSTDPRLLLNHETSDALTFPSGFTSNTAFSLGLALRARILSLPSTTSRKPALISITLGTSPDTSQIVFQCATEPGTVPDNEIWVRRKRNTVLRWGVSSWLMRQKLVMSGAAGKPLASSEVEETFARKYAVNIADYAVHGGAVPIRVRGVEGLVGVVVVSGLKQEDDHQVVVETMEAFIKKGEF